MDPNAFEKMGLPLAREAAFGFLYWLVLLLVLEPDNVARALHAGAAINWSQEIFRIAGASVLGASAMPMVLVLVRRFPILGEQRWRNAALHGAISAVMAAGLVFVSCVLADWFLASEHRPFLQALREEFVSNWLLLVYCIAGFDAIAHAVWFARQAKQRASGNETPAVPNTFLSQISIKERGRTSFISLEAVDWIETQGNYLALHAETKVHLIRESLSRLESQLDPAKFVRVHRRLIVAVDRIREIAPRGAGDALLRLKNGTELRASRSFRERLGRN